MLTEYALNALALVAPQLVVGQLVTFQRKEAIEVPKRLPLCAKGWAMDPQRPLGKTQSVSIGFRNYLNRVGRALVVLS